MLAENLIVEIKELNTSIKKAQVHVEQCKTIKNEFKNTDDEISAELLYQTALEELEYLCWVRENTQMALNQLIPIYAD